MLGVLRTAVLHTVLVCYWCAYYWLLATVVHATGVLLVCILFWCATVLFVNVGAARKCVHARTCEHAYLYPPFCLAGVDVQIDAHPRSNRGSRSNADNLRDPAK